MLKLSHISKTFNPGTVNEKVAIRDLSLHLEKGDFATIIGSNGAGKSTMFNAICGDFLTDSGSIVLDGEDITFLPQHARAKNIGRLYQDPMRGTAPGMTILENLALAAGQGGWLSRISKSDKQRFREQLALLDIGLEDRMNHPVGLLSGGQRQRISIGLSLMRGEKLIIADEPVSALDVTVQSQILRLLLKLHDEKNLTYMFISHDLNVVHHMCHRVIVMYLGRIVEMADVDELYDHPCHPYTRMLFDSILTDEEKETTDSVTVNEILPETVDGDGGCPFYGRCRYAGENCLSEVPTLTDIGTPGHPHLVRCERIAYGEKYTAAD